MSDFNDDKSMAELNEKIDEARNFENAVDSVVSQQYDVIKTIGQIQAFDTMHKFTGVGMTIFLKQVKESGAYKGLKVPDGTGTKLINTWDQFCELMGVSRQKADEDIQNLNVFGQEFMESAQKMGLGYRQLRQLRALPEGDLDEVLEDDELKKDPEALLEVIEDMAVKRVKEKKELEDSKASLKAKDKLISTKDQALNKAQEELAKLTSLKPDDQIIFKAELEQKALKDLHSKGLELMGHFSALLATAQAVMDLNSSGTISQASMGMANDLISGLCSHMANELLSAGIDIDFRVLTYPLELGDIALRGDVTEGA